MCNGMTRDEIIAKCSKELPEAKKLFNETTDVAKATTTIFELARLLMVDLYSFNHCTNQVSVNSNFDLLEKILSLRTGQNMISWGKVNVVGRINNSMT